MLVPTFESGSWLLAPFPFRLSVSSVMVEALKSRPFPCIATNYCAVEYRASGVPRRQLPQWAGNLGLGGSVPRDKGRDRARWDESWRLEGSQTTNTNSETGIPSCESKHAGEIDRQAG